MADDNAQWLLLVRQHILQGWQKNVAVGRPRRVHQNSGMPIIGFKQNAVGGAAPLQGIFQFKAVSPRT